jgi:hypothetical protein
MSTPRDKFCRLIVQTLHDVINDSKPGSPIRQACVGFGDHFIEVASRSVSVHVQRELGRTSVIEQIEQTTHEAVLFVAARTAGLVQRTMLDLITAWEGRRYFVDGQDCGSLDMLLRASEAFTLAEHIAVQSLCVGDRLILRTGSVVTLVLESKQGSHAA